VRTGRGDRLSNARQFLHRPIGFSFLYISLPKLSGRGLHSPPPRDRAQRWKKGTRLSKLPSNFMRIFSTVFRAFFGPLFGSSPQMKSLECLQEIASFPPAVTFFFSLTLLLSVVCGSPVSLLCCPNWIEILNLRCLFMIPLPPSPIFAPFALDPPL